MDFEESKPIYLQISDDICHKILGSDWLPENRIPSVRELGAILGVNPNTVLKAYEHLQRMEVIYNKRGIGFYASADAKEIIISIQKKEFLEKELPSIIKKMDLLGIDPSEIFNK